MSNLKSPLPQGAAMVRVQNILSGKWKITLLDCNDFKIRYAMGGSIRPPYSFNSVRSFGLNCIFPHNRCTLFFIGHTTHSPSIFPALIFISVCVRSL